MGEHVLLTGINAMNQALKEYDDFISVTKGVLRKEKRTGQTWNKHMGTIVIKNKFTTRPTTSYGCMLTEYWMIFQDVVNLKLDEAIQNVCTNKSFPMFKTSITLYSFTELNLDLIFLHETALLRANKLWTSGELVKAIKSGVNDSGYDAEVEIEIPDS